MSVQLFSSALWTRTCVRGHHRPYATDEAARGLAGPSLSGDRGWWVHEPRLCAASLRCGWFVGSGRGLPAADGAPIFEGRKDHQHRCEARDAAVGGLGPSDTHRRLDELAGRCWAAPHAGSSGTSHHNFVHQSERPDRRCFLRMGALAPSITDRPLSGMSGHQWRCVEPGRCPTVRHV